MRRLTSSLNAVAFGSAGRTDIVGCAGDRVAQVVDVVHSAAAGGASAAWGMRIQRIG
jgi:hypothetical protein